LLNPAGYVIRNSTWSPAVSAINGQLNRAKIVNGFLTQAASLTTANDGIYKTSENYSMK